MSGARPDTWMPLYIGDYLADTMHLTHAQHGAYLLLIFAYWRRGGPLVDDDGYLAAIAKATASEWRRLRTILAVFFQIKDGLWHHGRIDAELARAISKTDGRSKAGSKGAARRWQTDGNAIVEPLANAITKNAPSQSPSSLEIKEVIHSLSNGKRFRGPSPNYDDPDVRKARWQQKIEAEIRRRLPPMNANVLIEGYMRGETEALAFYETVDADLKLKRARGTESGI